MSKYNEDSWTARDEAEDERRFEERQEYAQDLYEERQAKLATRCQCYNEMPGHCPGPANCPMCIVDPYDSDYIF